MSVEKKIKSINKKPYCEIIEQPKKLVRFRYKCEGSAAGIQGINSTHEKKTYPTIKINNCNNYKKGAVLISCVNKEKINGKYSVHPHKIVSKDSKEDGTGIRVIDFKIMNNTVIIECTGLGIQNTRRRDIKKIIEQREKMEFDPFKAGFNHKNSLSTIDVTAVRFCFHVILINDDEGKTIVLDPFVTHVMSSILTNNLRIYRLNRCSAPANGGTEITLLCDKVSKKDIKVLLYQKDDNNKIIWKRYADIIGVHRQIGITIKTPKYNRQSTEIIKGFIQLVKPSDGQSSQPHEFVIIPNNITSHKRKCKFLEKHGLFKKIRLQNNTDDNLNDSNISGANDFSINPSNFSSVSNNQYSLDRNINMEENATSFYNLASENYEQQQVVQHQYDQFNFSSQQQLGQHQYDQFNCSSQQQLEQNQYDEFSFSSHQEYYNSHMIMNHQNENYPFNNHGGYDEQDFNQIYPDDHNQFDTLNQNDKNLADHILNIINEMLPQMSHQELNGATSDETTTPQSVLSSPSPSPSSSCDYSINDNSSDLSSVIGNLLSKSLGDV